MRPSPSVPSSVLFLLSSGDLGEPRGVMGVNSHTVKEMVGSDVTGFTQDSQLQAALVLERRVSRRHVRPHTHSPGRAPALCPRCLPP